MRNKRSEEIQNFSKLVFLNIASSIPNIIHKINLFEIVNQTNENIETIGSY